jgi:hypothetical protein
MCRKVVEEVRGGFEMEETWAPLNHNLFVMYLKRKLYP